MATLHSLQQEREAIWRTYPSENERRKVWARRVAEIHSYLDLESSSDSGGVQFGAMNNLPQSIAIPPHSAQKKHIANRRHSMAMQHSATYAYGSLPSWPPTSTLSTSADVPGCVSSQVEGVQVYDIEAYVAKVHNNPIPHASSASYLSRNEQHVDDTYGYMPGGDRDGSFAPIISHSPSMISNFSTASSAALSDIFTDAELSRQSSSTTSNTSELFDMTQNESAELPYCSVADRDFTFSDISSSIDMSLASLYQSSSQFYHQCSMIPSFDSNENTALTFSISADGNRLPVFDTTNNQTPDPSPPALTSSLKRTFSHPQNIAPKVSPGERTSENQATDTNSGRPLAPRNNDVARTQLEAIARPSYTRPQHPKLYCQHCTAHPSGFRGEHELRRHVERAHASRKRVWICRTPPQSKNESSPDSKDDKACLPAKPLEICRQCKTRKPYNVYYNAAAHLRRAHFCPRKRGRRAKGEIRESRAGKAGGDWPSIEWLKSEGWLVEIEIDGDAAADSSVRWSHRNERDIRPHEVDFDIDSEYDGMEMDDGNRESMPVTNESDHSMWGWSAHLACFDDTVRLETDISQAGYDQDGISTCGVMFEAPDMAHSFSAPAAMEAIDPIGLHQASSAFGVDFSLETRLCERQVNLDTTGF